MAPRFKVMSDQQPWTVGRLLTWTTKYFDEHGADSPRLDAEVLLAEARRCSRIDLYTTFEETVDDAVRTTYRELVRRRVAGTPVAYLVGRREFYALDFQVTPDVLIPRPETELLVVALLDLVKARSEQDSQLKICDVGTGSGILAVCAAKHVPHAEVTAIDVSDAALAVARQNAERHHVAENIRFLQSDLLQEIPAETSFDYIISNPPYVSTSEMADLQVEVAEHEPHLALHGGQQGTDIIGRLLTQAEGCLAPDGAFICEISPMISEAMRELVHANSSLEYVETIRDHAGLDRVVIAQKASP